MEIKLNKQGMKKLEKQLEKDLNKGMPTGKTPKETAAAREKHLKKKGVTNIDRRALLKQAEEEHKRK
ncbi:hypothetical protein [Corynebacterium kalidii]